jgi:hypothetical protein
VLPLSFRTAKHAKSAKIPFVFLCELSDLCGSFSFFTAEHAKGAKFLVVFLCGSFLWNFS